MKTRNLFSKRLTLKETGFKCVHCHVFVPINMHMGTANRNHCYTCLWSKHVDDHQAGDRKSSCQSGMKPIALTFKQTGRQKHGEVMLVHECTGCHKISINRIAADDIPESILKVYEESSRLDEKSLSELARLNIRILDNNDKEELHIQLFGKPLI